MINNPNCGFSTCKNSEQNVKETKLWALNFVKDLNQFIITNENILIILKSLIDMDASGNKLSSGKIPDQYLKKQKSY